MNRNLLCTVLLAFSANLLMAQDSTKFYSNRHSPIGLYFEAPGIFFWNYENLNNSNVLVADVRNADHLIGVGMYAGLRDKFFIGTGFSAHSYRQRVKYTYYNPNFGGEFTSSAETWIKNVSINATGYIPVFRKNRSTIFAFTGVQFTALRMKVWQRDSQSLNGIVPVEYSIMQPWNIDAGLMFDFFRTDIITTDASVSLKIGYSLRLKKANWFTAGEPKPRLEETNGAGFHLGLVLNIF
jgi:hypothetical protein